MTSTTAPTIRRATETNWPWRLVEEADLVAGLRVLMIDANREIDPTTSPWGEWVVLDDHPVEDRDLPGEPGVPYVFYHCELRHNNELQCFTRVDEFTATRVRQPGDWPSPHYWLPINP